MKFTPTSPAIAPVPVASQAHDCVGPPPGGHHGPPPSFERTRRALAAQFDDNHDGQLTREQRAAAQRFLADERAKRGRPQGPFGFPEPLVGPNATRAPAAESRWLSAPDLATDDKSLYDPSVVHTLFLDFADADWEQQLIDFYDTDIELPAMLRLGHTTTPDVSVRFRGMSSFMMVPAGLKHSLNVSIDAVHEKQSLLGARTLNLLNSHEDPSYLRAVLYLEVARQYLPAARANLVHVAINGRDYGVYVNVEQFNADFIEAWFKTRKGARFKVPGSPGGRGGLAYLGEDKSAYAAIYNLRSKDSPRVWQDLIRLCKTLSESPLDQLASALEPLLDIDGALKFLALENVFINNDGYWIRASDYNLYQDEHGRFHLIPHDANETFLAPEHVPGSASGVQLDPLVGLDDKAKPLRSRLLQVPAFRQRYLQLVREIAATWLDWKTLGPIVEAHRARVADLVKADTRKLDSYEDFEKSILSNTEQRGPCGMQTRVGLRPFAEQRRAYLLGRL